MKYYVIGLWHLIMLIFFLFVLPIGSLFVLGDVGTLLLFAAIIFGFLFHAYVGLLKEDAENN